MRQTLAPAPRTTRNDVQCIRKSTFSTKTIDAITGIVEEAIKAADTVYDETTVDPSVKMMSDLLYDDNGLLRLRKFIQYGTFYIFEVFDTSTNKYFYLAYSIFDVIDYFNSNTKENIPYIRLYESLKDVDIIIRTVSKPKTYDKESAVINESHKFLVDFGDDEIVLYVSPTLITTSSYYGKVDSTEISKNVVGNVSFIVGNLVVNKNYCYKTADVTNSEYKDIFEELTADIDLSAYAPNGIHEWVVTFADDDERVLFYTNLEDAPTFIGGVTFTAALAEEE